MNIGNKLLFLVMAMAIVVEPASSMRRNRGRSRGRGGGYSATVKETLSGEGTGEERTDAGDLLPPVKRPPAVRRSPVKGPHAAAARPLAKRPPAAAMPSAKRPPAAAAPVERPSVPTIEGRTDAGDLLPPVERPPAAAPPVGPSSLGRTGEERADAWDILPPVERPPAVEKSPAKGPHADAMPPAKRPPAAAMPPPPLVVRTAAEWNRAESLIVAFLETEREADGWRFTSDEAAQDWRNRLLLAPAIFEGRRVGTWVGSSASGTLFASVHGWRWLLHCLHEVLPLIAGDPYEKISGYFSELLTIDEEIDFSFCGNALLCAPKELFWLLEAVISSGLVPVTYAPPTVEEAERLVGQIKDALRTLADVAFRASSLLSQVNLNGLQDCDGHSARQIFFQAGLADSQLAAAFLLSEGLLKLSRGSAWDYVAMFFDEDSRFSLKAFKAHGRPLSVPE